MRLFRITLGAFLLLSSLAAPDLVLAEEAILSFHSRIVVRDDGVLDVTEMIRVRAEGRQIKRGILRDFPTKYGGVMGNTGINVLEVTKDGGQVNWKTESRSNGVRVRIGSANQFLSPGDYSYVIHYTTPRQLRFSDEADELYWNVTGQGWDFPIQRASATVILPEGAQVQRTTAYTGRQGDTGSDFRVEQQAGTAEFTTTRELRRGEGLTIVVDWPPGYVYRASVVESATGSLLQDQGFVAALIGLLALIAYFIAVWLKVGQDPDGGPVIARYKPPSGLSPAACSFVLNMGFKDSAFAAAIVSMAVKGDLIIKGDVDDDPKLVRTGHKPKLSLGERAMARRMFRGSGAGEAFQIEQKNHEDIAKAIKSLKNTLSAEYEAAHFDRNGGYFWASLGIVALTFVGVVGLMQGNIGSIIATGAIVIIAIVLYRTAAKTKAAVLMLTAGSVKGVGMAIGAIAPLFVAAVIFLQIGNGLPSIANEISWPIIIPLAIMGVIMIVFHHLLKAPTRLGRRVMDEIEGFKLYLSVAEKDRMNFHNPPHQTPELFEKYLPYAIALGVEHEWGEQFESVLAAAALDPDSDGGYHPHWYHGGYHRGHFSSSRFSSSLGGGFAGAISSAATAPSQGGSGFSSGGGFSGGGGGGGGGGGW